MPQVKLLGKTLELENPNQPTEQDILTIKNTFKIPEEFTLDQTRGALSQMIDAQTAGSRNIAADIPEQFPPTLTPLMMPFAIKFAGSIGSLLFF